MKLVTNYGPIYDHATGTFYDAADDTLRDVANAAPWRTGRYSRGLKLRRRKRPNGPTARIVSDVPYAKVLEWGGKVKSGRGVHIEKANAPAPLRMGSWPPKTTEVFGRHYERRLASTAIGSAFGGGGALDSAGIELGG